MSEGNKPKFKVRAGSVVATVWENEVTKDGKQNVFTTTTLERSYKDKKGEWQSTQQLGDNDLPKAIATLQEVYNKNVLKLEE